MSIKATVTTATPVVPDGIYPAEFVDISEATSEQSAFGSDTYWLWEFLLFVKGKEVSLTGTSSPKLTPKTKASKWLFGLTGRQLAVGEEVDFDTLKGTRCQIVTTTSDDGMYSRIESVLPAPSA
jgi:hypothetical protein